ncbi:putative conserved membrane protein [Synechococcus sp. A18-25c]|nr:putative conserved membrane protein [Synechococcus sp. A18-25c]
MIALAFPIGISVIMGLIYCFDSNTLSCTDAFVLMFAFLGCSLLSALGASRMWTKASRVRAKS